MAGGWAQDGAVNEQIEVSTQEAIERMRLRRAAAGESRETCADCDEPIPEARRLAVMQKFLSEHDNDKGAWVGPGSYLAGFVFERSNSRICSTPSSPTTTRSARPAK